MFFARGDVHEPVAVAHIFIREAEFFRAEQQSAASGGGEVRANERSAHFQPLERVLEIAMSDGGGPYNQRAIGHGVGDGFELFGASEEVGRPDGGTRPLESDVVRIDYAEVLKSEIAHGTGGRSDIERIARVHQDDAQMIEFGGNGQTVFILRQCRKFRMIVLKSRAASTPFAVEPSGPVVQM